MTIQRVNLLNIGLIVLSALCALRFPLETFLAAYAFLGPLHYLTELSWLEQRAYFMPDKRWVWILVGLCVFVVPLARFVPTFAPIATLVIVAAFLGSLIFVRAKRTWADAAILATIAIVCGLFFRSSHVALWVAALGILLTTVIHVCVFTGMFMFGGALREKGSSGWVAFGVFVGCVIALLWSGRIFPEWGIAISLRSLYQDFFVVNQLLVRGIGVQTVSLSTLFESSVGLGVMRFIAFAYLYHYLNWFSKTSIIQWHTVSRARGVLIVFVWLSTVVLYLVDYRAGLLAMVFLSLLHVFLEFPLNWKMAGQITHVIWSRWRMSNISTR